MSLLTMIQDVTDDLGLAKPSQVIGSGDAQVLQLLQIAQREGDDLASRFNWSALLKENTFTRGSSESQGALNSTVVTDGDFDKIIPETMWNRTTVLPIVETPSNVDWSALKAHTVSGPYDRYKIEQGNLYIYPTSSSADTIAFQYKSTHWCQSDGGVSQASWLADDDTGLLDEKLMALGITWRWLKRKGLDYAEDFNTYEKRVLDAKAGDGANARQYLNGHTTGPVPGVTIKPFSPI